LLILIRRISSDPTPLVEAETLQKTVGSVRFLTETRGGVWQSMAVRKAGMIELLCMGFA
jgi:hypothetical protein